jgi:transcriptional regulator with PAS, ATPase and Fis domain
LSTEKEREATERKIATYEEILLQIKEFSGEDDIDRLVAHFVKQEEENFAIFNYVNELNNEVHIVYVCNDTCSEVTGCNCSFVQVESLQDQVCELHKKIESERDLNSCRVMQQQERLDSLVNTLTVKRTTADSAERKLQEHSVILEKLLQGIDHIFHVLGCDNAPILSLLGESSDTLLHFR